MKTTAAPPTPAANGNGWKKKWEERIEWGVRIVLVALLGWIVALGGSINDDVRLSKEAIIKIQEQASARTEAVRSNQAAIQNLAAQVSRNTTEIAKVTALFEQINQRLTRIEGKIDDNPRR